MTVTKPPNVAVRTFDMQSLSRLACYATDPAFNCSCTSTQERSLSAEHVAVKGVALQHGLETHVLMAPVQCYDMHDGCGSLLWRNLHLNWLQRHV